MRRHFEITTKEVGREQPIKTDFFGDVTHKYLVDFFGLEEPDVEWYRLDYLYIFTKSKGWQYLRCNE